MLHKLGTYWLLTSKRKRNIRYTPAICWRMCVNHLISVQVFNAVHYYLCCSYNAVAIYYIILPFIFYTMSSAKYIKKAIVAAPTLLGRGKPMSHFWKVFRDRPGGIWDRYMKFGPPDVWLKLQLLTPDWWLIIRPGQVTDLLYEFLRQLICRISRGYNYWYKHRAVNMSQMSIIYLWPILWQHRWPPC